MFPPYTYPDQWGPTWSTVPAERRSQLPPWVKEAPRRATREEIYWEGQSAGGFGGWYVLGTKGSW
jgi:hypothetical protein